MLNIKYILITALSVAILFSCGRRNQIKSVDEAPVMFPEVAVPAMITDRTDRLEYAVEHYWDRFLEMSGRSDSLHVNGVPLNDVEGQFGTYSSLLWQVPVDIAVKSVSELFDEAETSAMKDTASNAFRVLANLAEKYLYDANSPVRNEEFFLPYVQGLANSEQTDPDLRLSYEYIASMCALNRIGQKATDFAFTDVKGRVCTLYGVKAEYTLLFFINPGCHNCKEITQLIKSDDKITALEKTGRLSVVSIYIDEEISKWKEAAPTYPKDWICGYDHKYLIRSEQIYNVRAIPSLYLLDKDKKVILKDAPQDKVFEYLDNL